MTSRPDRSCNVVGCTEPAIDRYVGGWRCASHTPAMHAGHAEPPTPDPDWTLTGLRHKAGRADVASPVNASQLHDDRAVASGSRRASQREYDAARMRLGIIPWPTAEASE